MKKATEEKVDSVSKSNQLRKKIVTNKLTYIEVFMKVLSVLVVFMLFMSVEPVNAGPASLIAKGAKKRYNCKNMLNNTVYACLYSGKHYLRNG